MNPRIVLGTLVALVLGIGSGESTIAAPATFQVGAAKTSITPNPPAGETWQTENCSTEIDPAQAASTRKTSTPNCIYMGGRGLGPSEPIRFVDPANGLFVRAVAIGDGEDIAVLVQVDGVYWFGRYASFCDRCGAFSIAEDLGAELALDPAGIVIAGSHTHNAPDFIGGWGGVPRWYMDQVADAIRDSIRGAVDSMRDAQVEVGEAVARDLNAERRNFYHSAEDATFTWFRAVSVDDSPGETIATVGTFSAHPVTTGYDDGRGHGDWPGLFSIRMNERFGGVGIGFVAGLGNMLTRQGTAETADGLAGLIPEAGTGRFVEEGDVRFSQEFWSQPVSNLGLTGLRGTEFFDRSVGGPATIVTGRSEIRPCASVGVLSVETAVSAIRIGDILAITAGPGELFANLTNTLKEKAGEGVVTLPLSAANDGLGYMMQSFEANEDARHGTGFVGGAFEYEEAFGIDRCVGDAVLEKTLDLLGSL